MLDIVLGVLLAPSGRLRPRRSTRGRVAVRACRLRTTRPLLDRTPTRLTPAARDRGNQRLRQPSSPGRTMRAVSPESTTFGCTGIMGRPRACSSKASAETKPESCWSCLIVGNTSSSSRSAAAFRAAAGAYQRASTTSPPSTRLRAVGRRREEEPGVVADLDLRRGDPPGERHEPLGRVDRDPRLLAELPDRRGAQRGPAAPSPRSTAPPGKPTRRP